MNEKQKRAWAEAQNIPIGEDLVSASRRQLEFLAAVDRRRWLYDSPGLERAIYRYKTCWLPLLAKHTESQAPLVVPLDCEWIWHCHRLNPVQYKSDCEKVYGKILDKKNVVSSLQAKSENKSEEIWSELYPNEPFQLNYSDVLSDKNIPQIKSDESSEITYDLISAAKRQTSFYYQVSRSYMSDNRMMTSALERYKGFLYLIKSNREKSLNIFCVPTYDVDIMWHSHQLSPVSYCNDSINLIGKVLEHDDTDSDRSKGKKLDTGFSTTTEQFEKVFGKRYWKAGVMYRGAIPTPLKSVPILENTSRSSVFSLEKSSKSILSLNPTMLVEVFLEVVEVKNVQISENEFLYVSFTKKQQDMFFSGDHPLDIFSFTKEKHIAGFECEPTGDLILTLISKSQNSKLERVIGTTSISLKELTDPKLNLSIQKWFEVKFKNRILNSDPIHLHVAVSCTVPVPAPILLNMVKYNESYFQSIFHSINGKDNQNNEYGLVDNCGNEIIRVQMRDIDGCLKKKVIGIITGSRKNVLLAEGNDNKWLLNQNCNNFSCMAEIKANEDGTYMCELKNDQMVKLYWGKRLEYEDRSDNEGSFITAVEFSAENPYGKAIAMLDMKSKLIKMNKEWFVLPWVTLSFIFMNLLDKQNNRMKGPLTPVNEAIQLPNAKDNITPLASEIMSWKTPSGGFCGFLCAYRITSNSVASKTAHIPKCTPLGCENTMINNSVASETVLVPKTTSGSCGGCCGGSRVDAISSSVESKTAQVETSAGFCGGVCGYGGCRGVPVNSSNTSETVLSGGCGGSCGGGCGNVIISSPNPSESVQMKTSDGAGCWGCTCADGATK